MPTLQAARLPGKTPFDLQGNASGHAHLATATLMMQAEARCKFIKNMVALGMRVNVGLLSAATRQRAPVAFARQVAMYLAHIACGLTLTDIGRCFGRDRTTVAHACQRVEDLRDDPAVDLMLDYFEAAVTDWFRNS